MSEKIRNLNKAYMQIVLNLIVGSTILSRINSLYYFVVVEIFFVLAPCLILVKQKHGEISMKALNLNKITKEELKLSFIVPLLAYPLIILINTIFIMILPELQLLPYFQINIFSINFLLNLFIYVFVPAITEELLFRGYFLDEYKEVNQLYALILVSFLFALAHLNPYNFISSFLLSLLLGHLVLIIDSIIPAIIGHFVNNSIVLLFSNFQIQLLNIRNGVLTLSKNTDYDLFWLVAMLVIFSSFFLVKILVEVNKKRITEEEEKQHIEELKIFIKEHKFNYKTYKYILLIIFLFAITFLTLYL